MGLYHYAGVVIHLPQRGIPFHFKGVGKPNTLKAVRSLSELIENIKIVL
ncbi:hypothetical protein [Flammeovirga sp. EKP202]|nr:hypothetical protein [Flammeovirga sp. EKP202]MBD0404220.1 hypothetical protein [Flammeovirga sp. EKP202]